MIFDDVTMLRILNKGAHLVYMIKFARGSYSLHKSLFAARKREGQGSHSLINYRYLFSWRNERNNERVSGKSEMTLLHPD